MSGSSMLVLREAMSYWRADVAPPPTPPVQFIGGGAKGGPARGTREPRPAPNISHGARHMIERIRRKRLQVIVAERLVGSIGGRDDKRPAKGIIGRGGVRLRPILHPERGPP